MVAYDDLKIGPTFVEVAVHYWIKNFGQSPAYVEIQQEIVDIDYPTHIPELLTKIDRYCDDDFARVSNRTHYWPATSVPGEMGYNQIVRKQFTEGMNQRKPTVIGCIWYRSTIGEDTIHRAQFSGHLSLAQDKSGHLATDLNPIPIPTFPSKVLRDDLKVVDVSMAGKAN